MIVRELTTLAEFEALSGVFGSIWRPEPSNRDGGYVLRSPSDR